MFHRSVGGGGGGVCVCGGGDHCIVPISKRNAYFPTDLSVVEGWKSRSTLERQQLTKLYYFQLFNVFLITALSTSVLDQMNAIIHDPGSVINSLAIGLPAVCVPRNVALPKTKQ